MALYNEYTETNVTSGAAVSLTIPAAPAGRGSMRIQVSQRVRMRFDGSDPTTSVGWVILPDNTIDLTITEDQARAARFIAEGTSGVIRAIFI